MWLHRIALLLLLAGCGAGPGAVDTATLASLVVNLDLPDGVRPAPDSVAFQVRIEGGGGGARERAYPMTLVSGPFPGGGGRARWSLRATPDTARAFTRFLLAGSRLPSRYTGTETVQLDVLLVLCRDQRGADFARWLDDEANWIVFDGTLETSGPAVEVNAVARPYVFGDPAPAPILPCPARS